MKYAIEIAKTGSLGKASEKLLKAVPNISRSIKKLEADIGITIFERTAKGMTLTPDGEDFISMAQNIVSQLELAECFYKEAPRKSRSFLFWCLALAIFQKRLPNLQNRSQTIRLKFFIKKPTLSVQSVI